MKATILTVLVFLLLGCGTTREEKYYIERLYTTKDGIKHTEILTNFKDADRILEIYTRENIYFINIDKLEVSNEVDNNIIRFETWEELYEWVGETTARQFN